MLKKFLLGSILLLMFLSLPAKVHALRMGLLGGLDLATFTTDGKASERRLGFIGGFYYDIALPISVLSIQPELYYIHKGGKEKESEESLQYSYFELPVFVKANFPISSWLSVFLLAGPTASFLTTPTVELDDNINDIDLGFLVGLGFGIKISKISRLAISGRYGFGFIDFTRQTEEDQTKSIHRSIEIILAVGIHL